MKMKLKILSIIVFSSVANSSLAEDFIGRMDCEVKSNKVTSIIEGKPQEYSGFEDGFRVGDPLVIDYKSVKAFGKTVAFLMRDEQRDAQLAYHGFSSDYESAETDVSSYGTNATFWSMDSYFGLGQDEIRFSAALGAEVYLARYYKSDWHGVATFARGIKHQTVTLDCRNTIDKIEEVVAEMKNWKK